MNAAHKIGKLKNRQKRLEKRLADKDLPGEQRSRIVQRQAELEQLLK
jgi:hypothetical protein